MHKQDLAIGLYILPYIPFIVFFALRPSGFIQSPLAHLYFIIFIAQAAFSFLWIAIRGSYEIEKGLNDRHSLESSRFGSNYRGNFLAAFIVIAAVLGLVGSGMDRVGQLFLASGLLWGGLFFIYQKVVVKVLYKGEKHKSARPLKIKIWSGKNLFDQVKRLLILSLVIVLLLVILVVAFGLTK